MPLTREQKQKIIQDLEEKINRQKTMIFVDFTGLGVKELFELRRELKRIDSLFKVSKKTLFVKSLQDFDESLAQVVNQLEGELGIVFGFGDEILPAKIVYQFSSQYSNLKILGGFFGGKFIPKEQVIELAKIPSRQELLARLIGSISAPVSNFVSVLENNIKGLLFVLSAIK